MVKKLRLLTRLGVNEVAVNTAEGWAIAKCMLTAVHSLLTCLKLWQSTRH
jgi:hypothetical protein